MQDVHFPMSRDWARRIVSNPDTYLRTPPSVVENAWATLRADHQARRAARLAYADDCPTGGAA